jgi:peptide/nickel transport system substrate-binding protein
VEALINESRTTLDPARRAAAYDKIAQQVQKDRPVVYLYHRHWLWAHNAKLSGLRTVPDGMVRVQGLKMN